MFFLSSISLSLCIVQVCLVNSFGQLVGKLTRILGIFPACLHIKLVKHCNIINFFIVNKLGIFAKKFAHIEAKNKRNKITRKVGMFHKSGCGLETFV